MSFSQPAYLIVIRIKFIIKTDLLPLRYDTRERLCGVCSKFRPETTLLIYTTTKIYRKTETF